METGIVTISLNPALDLTGHLTSFNRGAVNNINHSNVCAAGKGVNVARVLCRLGASKVAVSGFLGKYNEAAFVALFESYGIEDHFIRVSGSTRINVKLSEQDGTVTDLNFPGFAVSKESIEDLERKLEKLSEYYDWFIFSGSLPKDFPAKQLAIWIKWLRDQNKRVLLDSSKEAFALGVAQIPMLVKPNDEELAEWINKKLDSESSIIEAADQLRQLGIEHVVVSQGEHGVLWNSNGHWFKAIPPKVHVISTVGAGDTMLAAMCWGLVKKWNNQKTLKLAVALSAQAVTQDNVACWTEEEVKILMEQVNITQL